MQRLNIYTVAIALTFALSSVSLHADLITNGDFDQVGAKGLSTQHDGQSPNLNPDGISAAEDWFVWHNQNGSTATELLTYDQAGIDSIDPGQDRATDGLIKVEASHENNGLVQSWAPLNSGPMAASGSVWIYVTGPGQTVGVGVGNGGTTQILDETSGVAGQWEQLSFNNSTSPANEITIYARNGSAEFYVDRVSVSAVPEPGVILPILGCILGGLATRRRR